MNFKYPTTKHKDLWYYFNSLSAEINSFYARISGELRKKLHLTILKKEKHKLKKNILNI